MVASMGPFATIDHEPRQVRKEAAVMVDSGAEVWLLMQPPNIYMVFLMITSIVLARKWRPRKFSELIGQEHVTKTLTHALAQQRLHHAYLFTGTRGVGKTSVARLLAKALNCEQSAFAEPCLSCDTCLAIEQGHYIDLIEIDAASKTRIEDTRELLDNVPYAPTVGRFKIYLIDEVHMLSTHSFNALLKTLEEPPDHIKFLLATTDPQKLPLTVLSRCLQFHLKPLHADLISHQMAYILNEENIPYDVQALPLLATAAHGSMRDALSLLEQTIAYGQGELRTQDVKDNLGITQIDYAIQILQALAARSISTILTLSHQMDIDGANYAHVLDHLLQHIHQICVLQALESQQPLLNSEPTLIELSHHFSQEETQLLYQIAIKGSQDLDIAPTRLIGFEMTLLRMHTFIPAKQAVPLMPIPSTKPQTHHTHQDTTQKMAAVIEDSKTITPSSKTHTWDDIVTQLKLSGLALAAAENAVFVAHTAGCVILRISTTHKSLFTPTTLKKIEQCLTDYYQEKTKLTLQYDDATVDSPAQNKILHTEVERQKAQATLHADPFFQSLQQTFSAELMKDSIGSRKDSL